MQRIIPTSDVDLPALQSIASARVVSALAELKAATLSLAEINVAMSKAPSLDQPGFDTSPGRAGPGPKAAEHAAERAAQDAQVRDLADKIVTKSNGAVPKAVGR